MSAGDSKAREAKVSTTVARLWLRGRKHLSFPSQDLTARAFSPQDSGFVGRLLIILYLFLLKRMTAGSLTELRLRNIYMPDLP